KNGIPSVHSIRGDEMRALRKLRRDYPKDAYVFVSERGGPITSTDSSSASARLPRCHSRSTRTCCAMPVGSSSPTMATTRAPCSTISGTRTSSTRCATPKWRPIASGTFGVDRCRRRQARHRFPLYHLGISASLPLGQHLLEHLQTTLELFIGHRLEPARMLDLHLPRHQHCAYLHVGRRLIPRDSRDHFRPFPIEMLLEREQEVLVERSTCSLQ